MAEIQQINFAVNAYQSRSRLLSSERVLNFYPELSPLDSPFKTAILFNTPGWKNWISTDTNNPVYGLLATDEFLYAVIGLTLYKISKTKITTILGTLSTSPGPVMMTENGVQITILAQSGAAYYYDISANIFGQITDPNYQAASSVTTLDGYSIFSKINSGQFFISALRDTTSYAALDFATAEALSDNIVRIVNYNRHLYIFGTISTEIWYDTGNATFPFLRIDGGLIQKGLGAKFSTALDTAGIYWLGEDGIVYFTGSYSPKRISTSAIETAINSYSVIDDATAFIYTQAGHEFYCLTFPSAKKTWVYDISNQLWSERGSLNIGQTEVVAWTVLYHAFFNNTNIVNGSKYGKLYELDLDTYTEDGVPIIRKVVGATQFSNYLYHTIDRLSLMLDFGVGIDGNSQGSTPLIMMRNSIDGGYTWSEETTSSLGAIGEYPTELFWEKLGFCRSFIIELTISDPVKCTILGAYLKATPGGF